MVFLINYTRGYDPEANYNDSINILCSLQPMMWLHNLIKYFIRPLSIPDRSTKVRVCWSFTRYATPWFVDLVVLSPHCIPAHPKSSTPPLFHISNMRGGKSQTGKQVERKCGSCGNTFRSQAFPAHVKKCERLKKAQDGREKYERELRERLLPKIACACHSVVSFVYSVAVALEPELAESQAGS